MYNRWEGGVVGCMGVVGDGRPYLESEGALASPLSAGHCPPSSTPTPSCATVMSPFLQHVQIGVYVNVQFTVIKVTV